MSEMFPQKGKRWENTEPVFLDFPFCFATMLIRFIVSVSNYVPNLRGIKQVNFLPLCWENFLYSVVWDSDLKQSPQSELPLAIQKRHPVSLFLLFLQHRVTVFGDLL